MRLEFMRCDRCEAARRPAAGLCAGCRHNRAVIDALLAEVPSPTARAAVREEAVRYLAGPGR
jgi:hypothetical protein